MIRMVLRKETESFVRASAHLQEDAKGNVFIRGFTAPNRQEKVDTNGMQSSTKIGGLTARWVVEQDTDIGKGDQFYEKKISMFNELDTDNVSIPTSTMKQIGKNPYSEPNPEGHSPADLKNMIDNILEDIRGFRAENNLHHILIALAAIVGIVLGVISLTKIFG